MRAVVGLSDQLEVNVHVFYCQIEKKKKSRKHKYKSFIIIKTDEPDGNNWAKIIMKKYLLKAVSICLGITLLCGMSSFRTPEGMKIQRGYQTAVITNDTIITSDGEESQCIKEVVVESERGCRCFLRVVDGTQGQWYLYLYNDCSRNVKATFTYDIYKLNGDIDNERRTDIIYEPGRNLIDQGIKSKELCCPGKITACLTDEEPTMPRK